MKANKVRCQLSKSVGVQLDERNVPITEFTLQVYNFNFDTSFNIHVYSNKKKL